MIKVGMNLLLWSDDTHSINIWLLNLQGNRLTWNLTGITNSFDECHKFGDYAAKLGWSHRRGVNPSMQPHQPDKALGRRLPRIQKYID